MGRARPGCPQRLPAVCCHSSGRCAFEINSELLCFLLTVYPKLCQSLMGCGSASGRAGRWQPRVGAAARPLAAGGRPTRQVASCEAARAWRGQGREPAWQETAHCRGAFRAACSHPARWAAAGQPPDPELPRAGGGAQGGGARGRTSLLLQEMEGRPGVVREAELRGPGLPQRLGRPRREACSVPGPARGGRPGV